MESHELGDSQNTMLLSYYAIDSEKFYKYTNVEWSNHGSECAKEK